MNSSLSSNIILNSSITQTGLENFLKLVSTRNEFYVTHQNSESLRNNIHICILTKLDWKCFTVHDCKSRILLNIPVDIAIKTFTNSKTIFSDQLRITTHDQPWKWSTMIHSPLWYYMVNWSSMILHFHPWYYMVIHDTK